MAGSDFLSCRDMQPHIAGGFEDDRSYYDHSRYPMIVEPWQCVENVFDLQSVLYEREE